MIDFVKFHIVNTNTESILSNSLLYFEQRNVSADGELIPYEKKDKTTGYKTPFKQAFYKSLKFRIYDSGFFTLSGSLHKFWNGGEHNFNDFGFNEINETLSELKNKFGILPENSILKRLELGVNIVTPYRPKEIIQSCLFHGTGPFKWTYTKDKGSYILCAKQEYSIKIYDKTHQYRSKGYTVPNGLIRFEKNFKKMKDIRARGIFNLKHLLNYGLANFIPDLLKELDKVLFCNWEAVKGTKYEHKYTNVKYWESLDSSRRKYHKKRLNILLKRSEKNIKAEIADLIKHKAILLCQKKTKTTQNIHLHLVIKPIVFGSLIKPFREAINRNLDTNVSMGIRSCFVFSHNGLKHYFGHNRKALNEVKRILHKLTKL